MTIGIMATGKYAKNVKLSIFSGCGGWPVLSEDTERPFFIAFIAVSIC